MYDCTVRPYLYSQQEESRFFQKAVLRIFKIALRLRGRHVFMRQSLEIFNVLDTLTLKFLFFWKTKTWKLQKNWSTVCSWKYYDWKRNIFIKKYPIRRSMTRQIEWVVQNRPITRNIVLPVTTLFFWKFCFSMRTCDIELI